MEDLRKTVLLFQHLGLLISMQKSQLTPSQEILYLGMMIDIWNFWVSPSPKRVKSCLRTVNEFVSLENWADSI